MERGKSEAARRADRAEAPLHQARGLQGDAPETFQRVGLITDGGAYCLDNPMDCFDNVFYGPEIISHLLFFKVDKEEDLDRDTGLRDFRRFPVGETVLIYQGRGVLGKMEPLGEHWDVFGVGFSAVAERRMTSRKTGAASPLGSAKIAERN